jgi:hypothetical protein
MEDLVCMVVDAVPLSENLKEMIFTSGTSYSTFFEGNEKIRIEEKKKNKEFSIVWKAARCKRRETWLVRTYMVHFTLVFVRFWDFFLASTESSRDEKEKLLEFLRQKFPSTFTPILISSSSSSLMKTHVSGQCEEDVGGERYGGGEQEEL